MKRSRLFMAALLVIAGIYILSTQNNSEARKAAVKIGISQITSHPANSEIIAGIKEGFSKSGYEEGKNFTLDIQNAQGDTGVNQAIAQKFAKSDYNLFIPLGTPSSQALVSIIKDKPIVFSAVTDPVTAGLVASNEEPGGNVTGTSDITLYREHLQLLKQIKPDAKRVGIIYNPNEANARFALEQAKRNSEDLAIEVVTADAYTTNDITNATQSIIGKVDAIYMLPDNTVLAGQDSLITVANDNKKIVIALDQTGVEKGAYATLGTNYKKVGERTAEIALKILEGANPGALPVLGVTDSDLFINKKTAEAIGIPISSEFERQAKQVY